MNRSLFHSPSFSSYRRIRWIVAIIGLGLMVHSVYLVFHRATHLGVQLPLLLGLITVILAWRWSAWQWFLSHHPRWRWAWRMGLGIFLFWLCSVAFYFAQLIYQINEQNNQFENLIKHQPSALVVLGSSTPNAKPSPTLTQRLLLAKELHHRYPQTYVVVSGGVDFRQTRSEADVMAEFLQQQGIPSNLLLLEPKSTSTHENLMFSLEILKQHFISNPISNPIDFQQGLWVITSDFHVARTQRMIQSLQHTVTEPHLQQTLSKTHVFGAPTPLYLRYNAWLREYFANLSGWLLREF